MSELQAKISRFVWETKYRYRREAGIEHSWRRVAGVLAGVEAAHREIWAEHFYRNLRGFRFLPGGRILVGAGTEHRVTLFNCFVMGSIEDSMESIFEQLKGAALTLQQGGGIGCGFSRLRPAGACRGHPAPDPRYRLPRPHRTAAIATAQVNR